MRKAFHVLYLFDFDTTLARRKLLWYKNHITKVLSFSNYFISYIEKHRSVMIMNSMLEKSEGQTIFINYEMSQVHFLNQKDCGNTVKMLMKHYNAWPRQFGWTFQLEEQQRDFIQLKLCIRDIL